MAWLKIRLGNGRWGIVDFTNPDIGPTVSSQEYTVARDYDSNGNLLYEGWALPGTSKATAGWKIKKHTTALVSGSYVDTDEQWAGGSETLANIWDDRASLSYS